MAQTVRPASDITQAGWINEAAGSELYSHIDEASPDDLDYIRAADCSTGQCEVKFSALTDPISSSGHKIKFRCRNQGAASTVALTATVKCGATTIASTTASAITTSWTTYTYTLTGSEADAITDYADLRVAFQGGYSGGGCVTSRPEVSWTEFETPDATIQVAPPSVAVTFARFAPELGGTGGGVYVRLSPSEVRVTFNTYPPELSYPNQTVRPRVERPISFEDVEKGATCRFCSAWCPGHALAYVDGKPVCARHGIVRNPYG